MKIEYRKGDFLEGPEKYKLHGCNAQGVMGSGAAKAVRAKYPAAFDLYRTIYLKQGLKLGAVPFAVIDGVVVFNGITQKFYGRDTNKQYVSYEAIKEVVLGIDWYMLNHDDSFPEVAMPKIGAGLGGGDWSIIADIIETNSHTFKPVVYEL